MRNKKPLDALFPKTRKDIMATLFTDPDRPWYLSDLAGHLQVTPSSLQRELVSLVEAGILTMRRDGRRTYYQPDPDSPIREDLFALIQKTEGIGPTIEAALSPLNDSIDFAFVYGSIARGEATSTSDVDVMIIGSITLVRLSQAVRKLEKTLRRPVNPSAYTLQEFAMKVAQGHHFLTTVMESPKLFLKGSKSELADAISRTTGQDASNESGRGQGSQRPD